MDIFTEPFLMKSDTTANYKTKSFFFFKNKMILLNPIIIFFLSSFLIGYFPDLMISSSSRRAFKKFVDASFQLLEFDPFLQNTGGIGVVTSPQLAFHLQLDASRPVRQSDVPVVQPHYFNLFSKCVKLAHGLTFKKTKHYF